MSKLTSPSLQHPIQGGAADAQQFGGPELVAAAEGQGFLQRIAAAEAPTGGGKPPVFLNIGLHQLRTDLIGVADDADPAHHVLEFPDVSGPVITEHGGFGLAAEAEIASRPLRGLGEKGVGQQDNVPLALAQRRDTQSQHIDAEVQICPEGASRTIETKSRLVAAIMRMSMGMGVSAPMRRMLCSCRTRSSLPCMEGEISPISSRKIVPV